MVTNNKYEDVIDEWIDLYTNKNMNTPQIAKLYGVGRKTVGKYLNLSGVDVSIRRVTEEMIEAWVDMYINMGLTIIKIADMYNISKSTVLKYINAAGIDTTQFKYPDDIISDWIDLYVNKDRNTVHIANLYSTNPSTVWGALHRAGVDTSNHTYKFGRIYVIFYNEYPIYIGQTQYSKEHRLKGHINLSSLRIGSLARFIDDNSLTVDALDIHLLEDDIPVECLSEVEKMYIQKWSSNEDILLHNYQYNR